MSPLAPFSSPLVQAVGWTLLHSLWQLAALGVLAAAALAALRRAAPGTRYAVACAALAVMCVTPLVTFALVADGRAAAPGGRRVSVDPQGAPLSGPVLPATHDRDGTAAPAAWPVVGPARDSTQAGDDVAAAPTETGARSVDWRAVTRHIERALPIVVSVWLAGVLALSARLFGGWWQTHVLRRRGVSDAPATLQEQLVRAAQRLGVARPVRLVVSTLAEVPGALGWLRPMILLPVSAVTGLPPRQLEAVLAHELAHIRRYDYLVNFVQSVIEVLLFYHPAVWWLSGRVRVEREQCCDDLAVGASGDALSLARALARLEELRARPAALAVAAGGGTLLPRIRRLLAAPAVPGPRPAGWWAGVVVAALAAGVGTQALRAQFAQQGRADSAASQPGPTALGEVVYEAIPPQTQPGDTVTGLVVDVDGRPVEGAAVRAIHRDDEDGEPSHAATTDHAGRFTLAGLAPDGYWGLHVDDPRYAQQWLYEHSVQVPFDPIEGPVHLKVQRPVTQTGIVLNEAGDPVPGVTVTLVREYLGERTRPLQGWLAFDLQVTKTDEHGQFTLNRLRAGHISLMLDHPDYARTITRDRDPGLRIPTDEIRVTIKRGVTLRGRVVDPAGRPLPGVSVRLTTYNVAHRSLGEWQVTTDAAGEFAQGSIAGVHAGYRADTWPVSAMLDDPNWTSQRYAAYQTDDQTLAFLEITAHPAGTKLPNQLVEIGHPDSAQGARQRNEPVGGGVLRVRFGGVVIGEHGRAHEVHAWREATDGVPPVWRTQRLDETGTTEFRQLSAGEYSVSVPYSLSSVYYPSQRVTIRDDELTEVTLAPGPARLHGVVRVDGAALAPPAAPAELAGAIYYVLRGQVEARGLIRPDGTYEITGLPLGPCIVRAHAARGSWPWPERRVELTAADTQLDWDLPSGRLHVTLSEPSTTDSLTLERAAGEDWAEWSVGHFGLNGTTMTVQHLPPGEYTVSTHTTAGPLHAVVRLDPGAPDASVELRRPQETGWITGTVRFEGSAELGDMDGVSAQPAGWHLPDYVAKVNRATGAYRLTDLPPGMYVVSAADWDEMKSFVRYPVLVEVRAGLVAHLDLNVPAARRIRLVPADPRVAWPTPPRWRVRTPTGVWLHCMELASSADLFSCHLALGVYLLEADFREHGRVRQSFTVGPGDGALEIPVAPPPPTSPPAAK